MSNRPYDGGPAFARSGNGLNKPQDGMTLRDYFAAKAMQAIISSSDHNNTPDVFANASYAIADAMLKARQS